MKNQINFLHLSTGYNPATKNFDGLVKNIPMCGSDGSVYYDNRLKISNIIQLAEKRMQDINTWRFGKPENGIQGYVIYKQNRVIYQHTINNLTTEL